MRFTGVRTPGVSTLHQAFTQLDLDAFEGLPRQWLQERGLKAGEALAIDGKRLRGLHREQLPGAHLVATYAQQTGLVAGQRPVAEKRNKPATVFLLLERLHQAGPVASGTPSPPSGGVPEHRKKGAPTASP